MSRRRRRPAHVASRQARCMQHTHTAPRQHAVFYRRGWLRRVATACLPLPPPCWLCDCGVGSTCTVFLRTFWDKRISSRYVRNILPLGGAMVSRTTCMPSYPDVNSNQDTRIQYGPVVDIYLLVGKCCQPAQRCWPCKRMTVPHSIAELIQAAAKTPSVYMCNCLS